MWSADLCAVCRQKRLSTSDFIYRIFRHNCILREPFEVIDENVVRQNRTG
jgi:hypothetical protein